MSVATSEISEPIATRSDERKIARNLALLRLGHEGVMLDKVQQGAAHLLRLAKRAAGDNSTEPNAPEEEDQVGVNIGNETHIHLPITESPPATISQEKPPSIPGSVAAIPAAIAPVNPLLAAVLGGALVLGGAAAGALWPSSGDKPAAADTDTDTTLGLHLPP